MEIDFSNFYDCIPEVFWDAFENTQLIRILKGGAGSGKSYFAVSEMIYEMVANGCNYLVVRQTAVSNRTSTYSLTRQIINKFNLFSVFKENKTDMTFTCTINGAMVYFRGLEDVERLKSISYPGGSGILERIIFEESSEGNFDSFSQLLIRFRGQSKNYFQFTLLLNPVSIKNWVKTELWDSVEFDIYRHHSTFRDNPFLDENYEHTLLSFKSSNPNFFEIYANGNWGIAEGRVFNNTEALPFPFDINNIDDSEILAGIDWGFNHPTALCLSVIRDGCLYTYDELIAYETTNKEYLDMVIEYDFIPKNLKVVYDSEDPARGKEFVNHGFSFVPAKKGKGSVLRTIDYIKSFHRWYIDPNRCPRLLQEVEQYSWRKDKDGNPLDEPVNIMDDAIAAVRYSIEHLALMKGKPSFLVGKISDGKKEILEVKRAERKKVREVIKAQRKERREERRRNKNLDKTE
jgi:phage terminase large subunit